MREFIKGVLAVTILVAIVTAILSWGENQPNSTTWLLRVSMPAVVLIALAIFILIHFQRDRAPDYLRRAFGQYFDRGGFCFVFTTRAADGVCWLDMFFQNRFERPCIGRAAIRPTKKWFGRRQIDAITFEVECGEAAFGVTSIAVPLPASLQGRKHKFEVGASVEYPSGRGRMMRFRDGVVLRTNCDFGNGFATTLQIAGAAGGAIVLSSPATTTLHLPSDVAEEDVAGADPVRTTFWRLGDPIDELPPVSH